MEKAVPETRGPVLEFSTLKRVHGSLIILHFCYRAINGWTKTWPVTNVIIYNNNIIIPVSLTVSVPIKCFICCFVLYSGIKYSWCPDCPLYILNAHQFLALK